MFVLKGAKKQRNMFGARIKTMYGEQLVGPNLQYKDYVGGATCFFVVVDVIVEPLSTSHLEARLSNSYSSTLG